MGLIEEPGWRVGLFAMLTWPEIASLLKSGEPTMARISPVEGRMATSAPFLAFLSASRATCSVTSRDRVNGGDEETRISGALHPVSTLDNWGCRNPVHRHPGDINERQ